MVKPIKLSLQSRMTGSARPAFVFLLDNLKKVASKVRASQTKDVAASLTGIKEKSLREPGFSAFRPACKARARYALGK